MESIQNLDNWTHLLNMVLMKIHDKTKAYHKIQMQISPSLLILEVSGVCGGGGIFL